MRSRGLSSEPGLIVACFLLMVMIAKGQAPATTGYRTRNQSLSHSDQIAQPLRPSVSSSSVTKTKLHTRVLSVKRSCIPAWNRHTPQGCQPPPPAPIGGRGREQAGGGQRLAAVGPGRLGSSPALLLQRPGPREARPPPPLSPEWWV